MRQITLDSIPVPNERALDNEATSVVLNLEAALEQTEMHIFGINSGGAEHCLIASIDSFVASVEPLLNLPKATLRTSLALALQEIAAEQLNQLRGSDYCLDEPSVTLLDVRDFLKRVKDEAVAWTCHDEVVRTVIVSVLADNTEG